MIICSNVTIIAPTIAAIALLLVVIICVVLFRRKKADKEHLSSPELIARNCKSVDPIVALVYDDDIKKRLLDIKEKLKYLEPSVKKDVYEADEGISRLLREFIIKLTAAPHDGSIIDNYTRQINVAIASRNVLL